MCIRDSSKGVAVSHDSVFSSEGYGSGTINRYSLEGQLTGTVEIPGYEWPGALAYDDVSDVLYMAHQQGEIVAFDTSGVDPEFLYEFESGFQALLSLDVDHFTGNLLLSTTAGFAEFTSSGEQLFFHPVLALAAMPARNIAASSDLDSNRDLDVSDLDILVQAIANDLYSAELDINNDGDLNGRDIDAWLEDASFLHQTVYTPGDIDLDGVVDVHDFNLWNRHKFTDSAKWSEGDLNADGQVDTQDFNIWNTHKFGGSPSVVPEPNGAACLVWLLILSFLGRRRLGSGSKRLR